MKNNLTEQESLDLLNAMLVGFEFLECLDKITGFNIYKHGLKEKVGLAIKELQKFGDNLEILFGVDDVALFHIMEGKKQLMKKIAPLRPEEKTGLNELLEMFFQMPEIMIHRNGIKLINS